VTAHSDPLLVVDAPSVLYRAFFALPKTITDDRKRPVNALLGALNMVLQVVSDHQPRAVVFCFGPDAAEYRLELYPPYHADRPPMPDELVWQWAQAPELFAAFGWTTVRDETLEADDLLQSLADKEVQAGGRALLLTGDRDLFTPRELAQQMARRIRAAEILVVRGGTHYTAVEYPELVSLRIERFYREHGY